jgi:hypothetical protein
MPNSAYQYSFRTVFPTCILLTHYRCQVSSFVERTLVTDGPRARCAPEQFMQTNTPKSKETPKLDKDYSKEIWRYNRHKEGSIYVSANRL